MVRVKKKKRQGGSPLLLSPSICYKAGGAIYSYLGSDNFLYNFIFLLYTDITKFSTYLFKKVIFFIKMTKIDQKQEFNG
jgi:hypothetical protein